MEFFTSGLGPKLGLGCGEGVGDVAGAVELDEVIRGRPPLALGIRPEDARRMPASGGGAESCRPSGAPSFDRFRGSLMPLPRAMIEMDSTSRFPASKELAHSAITSSIGGAGDGKPFSSQYP